MGNVLHFPGSRTEQAEYVSTDPVRCVVCGWEGDREDHEGEYRILEGIPVGYPWAQDGDAVCHDCTIFCAGCGSDLLDQGVFIGACEFAQKLWCWECISEALCPEAL
jgi:hypothetical protein